MDYEDFLHQAATYTDTSYDCIATVIENTLRAYRRTKWDGAEQIRKIPPGNLDLRVIPRRVLARAGNLARIDQELATLYQEMTAPDGLGSVWPQLLVGSKVYKLFSTLRCSHNTNSFCGELRAAERRLWKMIIDALADRAHRATEAEAAD